VALHWLIFWSVVRHWVAVAAPLWLRQNTGGVSRQNTGGVSERKLQYKARAPMYSPQGWRH